MPISKQVRDRLLVEAGHRCTICAEKAFEIHHIQEQADGGGDEEENLIVLCPNCHQHRYHRSGEFTRDQIVLYKQRLKEANEIEKRLLLNLEEIRSEIGTTPAAELEGRLNRELSQAAELIDERRQPTLHGAVVATAMDLAKNDQLRGGGRRAIEVEFEIQRAQEKAQFPPATIVRVDEDAYRKSNAFPAAYILELVLDKRPHSEWSTAFDAMYRRSFYMMKRDTRIVGDRIQMIVADSDNLQGHVDFAKGLVRETNEFFERQAFPEIDRQIDLAKAQALREYDAVESMKSKTKDLRL